ncbi:aldehyde dehydrogenase family protein [Phytohabitans suffuscus]|uniref:Aldehyde dehydrogenase n=1 Tax=Phytohabitans suffuscus TaxID=624315 RepID=A0A6F8YW64_9ACTN|nr:aldehyde dehydrogenase family protein [Phytohabitans suffuscus]BCB90304.1 aldehyde dehydrogenase [Phytohabitans suffuscus]
MSAAHKLMHIGGEWVDAAGGGRIESVDPTSEEVVATFPDGDGADVEAAVAAARAAAPGWRDLGWARRAGLLRELAARIGAEAEELARLDVRDAGLPLTGMRADVTGAVAEILYYAGIAPQTQGSTAPPSPDTLSYTVREPYGVVGRIVPFNHPFKFAAGKVAAPLAAGNAVVLKPGEQTSLSALELARIAAGVLPPGVLNVVTGRGPTAGAALVAHPDVHRVAFTGSVPAGRAVLRAAADGITHATLELGGKNPIVVFPDVDVVKAAHAAVAGMNIARCTGQSCGSTSRLFVHRDIAGAFTDALVARVAELRVGDPMGERTQVGPLAFRAHHERVMSYVRTARREGATVAYGGERPAGLPRGFFVTPAVLTGLDDAMTVVREEVFGPVLSVLTWSDVDEVVRRANDTPFGLTANVWTRDVTAAHRTAAAIEAGYVYVNGTGRRPTGMPFGGWKSSGLGKENSVEELVSYTREKTVTVTL